MPRPPLEGMYRPPDDPGAQQERNYYKQEIANCLIAIFLAIAGLMAVGFFLFLIPNLKPPSDSFASWVERFGAIIGIFSIFIDLRLRKIERIFTVAGASLPRPLFLSLGNLSNNIPIFERIAFGLAIFGAIVWAYGSVILFWLSKLI